LYGSERMMADYDLIATAAFGVESIVADELRGLGYGPIRVENGSVAFSGNRRDVARCNLWLRCADRVLIRIAQFTARDFGELFERTREIPWEDIITAKGKMHVVGKSRRSTLFSVPDCQSIVKKAVVEAMKRKYSVGWFEETGPLYRVEVALLNDLATITLDTTGSGLHKRGYTRDRGQAPLRETLAAALVKVSRWEPGREFADPFCGSGTIAIEAGLLGKNIAPGINRSFVSETWPDVETKIWQEAREEAREAVLDEPFRILASDVDGSAIKIAAQNSARAGLADVILFQKKGVREFRSTRQYGCIVCNPPYGERTGRGPEVEKTYREMGDMFRRLRGWSLFALTSHPNFERLFGQRAHKKRKLYNGNILCHLYQYLGPLPGKMRGSTDSPQLQAGKGKTE
jgi:putative N6-adenine-specific DNA methylase